jgi:hypothetical protein
MLINIQFVMANSTKIVVDFPPEGGYTTGNRIPPDFVFKMVSAIPQVQRYKGLRDLEA